MHVIARGVARSSRGTSRHACRIISGVRHPLPTRNFHRSAIAYRIPETPEAAATSEAKDSKSDDIKGQPEEETTLHNEAEKVETMPASNEETPRPRIRLENGFAATRRATRNKRPREVPPLVFPDWFWDRNVLCMGEDNNEGWRRLSSRGLKFVGETDSIPRKEQPEVHPQPVLEEQLSSSHTESTSASEQVDTSTDPAVTSTGSGPSTEVTKGVLETTSKDSESLANTARTILSLKAAYKSNNTPEKRKEVQTAHLAAIEEVVALLKSASNSPSTLESFTPEKRKELEMVLEKGESLLKSVSTSKESIVPEPTEENNSATSQLRHPDGSEEEDVTTSQVEASFIPKDLEINTEGLEKSFGHLNAVLEATLETKDKDHVEKFVNVASNQIHLSTVTSFSSSDNLADLTDLEGHSKLVENLREPDNPYYIERAVFAEIKASIRAGLTLGPPQDVEIKDVIRPDLLLQCPRDDGTSFLDEVVLGAASKYDADIVRLDSEDIAQIIGNYMGENVAWTRCDTSLLGYEAHRASGKLESDEKEDAESEETFDDPDEDDSMSSATKPPPNRLPDFLSSLKKMPMVFVQQAGVGSGNRLPSMQELLRSSGDSGALGSQSPTTPSEGWQDFKLNAAIEALIDAAEAKRARLTNSNGEGDERSVSESKSLIIQINEYKELNKTPRGSNILAKLREVAKRRWFEGKSIMIVGTTTAEDHVPATSRSSITRLQFDVVFGDHRTIFIPPGRDHTDSTETAFSKDEANRIRQTNIRHVEDMIQKMLGEEKATIDLSRNSKEALHGATGDWADITRGYGIFHVHRDLGDSIWGFARVHRIASTMVGLRGNPLTDVDVFFNSDRKDNTTEPTPEFEFSKLIVAMRLLNRSDKAKFEWARQERKLENGVDDIMEKEEEYDTVSETKKMAKTRMEKLKKTCNPHEVKLLGGVIDPSDIHTTFADVRAPPQIIEALKTLTSLSLIRPESFSYGVLATDKIPGLLLYGPPGTGKTLLAKAVAKESGATVLEVSAAQINDMYVGEGEKNVKAVFSLAKKLSPCVVFIDEADALFGARGDSNKRTSHRELINQFLREWDGMNDLSAFIMVATNRPFDLDEAVLRRLPRRLLIDLPLEKDREAILQIHLKGEILDPSTSLATLAKDTPFYSGSDLKNLSVAAALACVREENEAAKNYEGDEPYVFPPKRILTKKHFEKAMEEISASISEEMSTLTAIRKFDERYGDRKGRRKKGAGLGFGGTTIVERDSEAGRVRKIDVSVAA